MASSNHIHKVALVGAGGNCGSFITRELLQTGRHTVSAITRADSKTTLPEGVTIKIVDYDVPETLVEALKGHDALVITLSGHAPIQETEEKLVRAAAGAGVPWIFPNEWSPDTANENLTNDVSIFRPKIATRNLIQQLGKSSYIALSTGFWYEWSLGSPKNFGLDLASRSVTFFDDGTTKICVSTWPQIGRAVAALLSLPIHPEGAGTGLDAYRDRVVYVNSFTVSQRDMFASALRVTGTREGDWAVTEEPAVERWRAAAEGVRDGRFECFPAYLYTRVFFKDGVGDFESSKGTLNSRLGLPREDLDEATRRALERQRGG